LEGWLIILRRMDDRILTWKGYYYVDQWLVYLLYMGLWTTLSHFQQL
jgi:hypothetical protein